MADLPFRERVVRTAWRMAPQGAFSGVIGWWARRRWPAGMRVSLLRSFADKYGIDVAEAEKPLDGYSGLQEFFTRKLRPGSRPLEPARGAVVAPADGRVVEMGIASEGKLIDAKGNALSLAELLADDALAAKLQGGAFQVIYLSPRDYHRVHVPAAGRVRGWRYVPGTLFPVNDRSVAREPGLFAKNERLVTVLESDELGTFAVVMVAAVGVGHITAVYDPEIATHGREFKRREARGRTLDPAPQLGRGDELGVFNLGSTTVTVFEPGRVVLDAVPAGTAIRMGQRIGSAAERARSAGTA